MKAIVALLLLGFGGAAAGRELALTIDDLPRGDDGGPYSFAAEQAMTAGLLAPIRQGHVPVVGFVHSSRHDDGPAALRAILGQWLNAGAELGNHTATHPDIDRTPLADFEQDVLAGEPVLRELLAARGQALRYFRHPFLHVGATPADRDGLQAFLGQHGYTVAPVTIDGDDYAFAALYTQPRYRERVRRAYVPHMRAMTAYFERRSMALFGREIPQVLLIHASQMNAELLPDLLAMFRQRGYRFITLEQALADPAYATTDGYAGPGGATWLHRWALAMHVANTPEPQAPAWVMAGFEATIRN